jgi:hypothetical protein
LVGTPCEGAKIGFSSKNATVQKFRFGGEAGHLSAKIPLPFRARLLGPA